MKKIQDKIRIDGDDSLIKNISYVDKKDKTEIGIETISNKKNILNLIFEDLGYRVMTLDLVSYAGITKKNLPRGKSRFLAQEEVNILKRSTAAAERGSGSANIIGTALGFDKETQYNTIIDQGMGQIWFYREVNGIISVRIPIDSNTTLRSENEGKENLITVGDGQSIVIIIRQGG